MRKLSWLLGAALLVAVVLASLNVSEGREFARLVEQSDPRWLAIAFALQAAAYLAQAEVFRGAPLRAGVHLTLRMVGVSVPVALSATLIFRGLSFWLPMLPGLWFSRQVAATAVRRAP